MKLSQLMSTGVITIGPDAPLKEAARRMIEAGVSGLPVTDEAARLIGIITEADFVATEADRRKKKRAGLLRFVYRDEEMASQQKLVKDVMTRDVKTLGPDEDHADAARVMEKHGIKRIPVVDDDGVLVGLLSRSDILRAFARPDRDILDEVTEHLMKEILWIEPSRVRLTCVDGNVHLEGRLETRSDVNLLVELTRRVDGVVSVSDNLSFDVDNAKLEMTSPPLSHYTRPNW